jgi:transposase InsO family protein
VSGSLSPAAFVWCISGLHVGETLVEIVQRKQRDFEDNYRVYGRRKIKAALAREFGLVVDRDRIGRLMADLGIRGMRRGRQPFHDQARQDRAAGPGSREASIRR